MKYKVYKNDLFIASFNTKSTNTKTIIAAARKAARIKIKGISWDGGLLSIFGYVKWWGHNGMETTRYIITPD